MDKNKKKSNGMKILLLSSYLPYPLFDGGRIRLYNLLKSLKENHEVTLICEKRPEQSIKDIEEVKKICKSLQTVERPKVWSLKNLIKTLFSKNPLLVVSHTNKEFRSLIENELSANKFDLIHIETFYVGQNLPQTNLPTVLIEHNIEYEVYAKYAKKSSIFIKPFLYLDILKLKRVEKDYWKRATKLVSVSHREKEVMGERTLLVPNGVDTNKFKFDIKKNNKNKKVLFIGDFKWLQNRDSAVFIIKNIWPRIISENKNKFNLKLWIVGKNIPDKIKALKSDSIIFDENAPDDTELIFQKSDILLSPIRVGGGSNFKTLEAMSSGVPVVTSKLGNEGLDAQNNSEILVSDKPDDYVRSTLNLLNDEYFYEKIARNARRFVENNYDWSIISKKLVDVYNTAIK